ncbi:MAG: hypothetical protein ACLFVT_09895, partial [Syntrophobacteria bacterium]
DLELWAIEARLEDGTVLAPGEEHFTRVDPVHFLGASLEVAWRMRPRLTVRAEAAGGRRFSEEVAVVTPPFAPTVRVRYPDAIWTTGLSVTVEL